MLDRTQKRWLGFLALAVLAAGWTYRDTFQSMVAKWCDDAAYTHGFLIVPIVLWLVWRRRESLSTVAMRPYWPGIAVLLCSSATWVVARGVGILVLEQTAAIGIIVSLVLAILGPAVTRILIFPLAFAFFAVPFGRAVVPLLMQVTADFATTALQWSGIPVYRTHMHIIIPGGQFEVARACSGLNFVMTGLVLGVLYAHLRFRSWTKRLLCVAGFVLVPVLANGLRVYFTILVSHFTDMRFGPGVEHVTFGRIFFVAVLFCMIWVARHWHDDVADQAAGPPIRPSERPTVPTSLREATTATLALAVALLAPQYLLQTVRAVQSRLADSAALVLLPAGARGWAGPLEENGAWRPSYRGGVQERLARYRPGAGLPVDVFVSVYGLGTTLGGEMISYGNVLFPEEHASLAIADVVEVTLPSGDTLAVREVQVPARGASLLVWSWYLVGERPVAGPFAVKALEAVAFVLRTAHFERIVTIATPLDDEARMRLSDFVSAHSECVGAGFKPEACRG